MKIISYFNISSTDSSVFDENLRKVISRLQNDGQEVEIQYAVNSLNLVYSALIIGRKD